MPSYVVAVGVCGWLRERAGRAAGRGEGWEGLGVSAPCGQLGPAAAATILCRPSVLELSGASRD